MRIHKPTSLHIPATDGFALAASLFPSERRPTLGALIVAGAVGNRRQNYTAYAAYMAEKGWDVLTFDYRGIGESAVPWKTSESFTMVDWGEKDVAGVIDWAREHLDPARLVWVGHSIGGQVVGFAPNNDALNGLVGVAAQRGYWPYWPGWRKYGVYLFFGAYVPLSLRIWGRLRLGLAGLADLPRNVAREWAHWGVQPEYQDAGGNLLRSRFARFRAPILALSFSDDLSLAPARAVDVLFTEHYVNAPLTRWHLHPKDLGRKGLGHSGFFNPKVCPESLWQATTRWILHACGRTPLSALPDARSPRQRFLTCESDRCTSRCARACRAVSPLSLSN